MSVSDSSKHLIQICQLLEERNMSFSFCLNKADLLVLCGMALLYQGLELKQESKLLKDNEKVVNTVVTTVGRMKASVAYDFRRVADLLIKVDEPQQSLPTPPGHSPDPSSRRPPQTGLSVSKLKKKFPPHGGKQPQQCFIGRHSTVSETDLLAQQEKLKKMAIPPSVTTTTTQLIGPRVLEPQPHRSSSRSSLDGARPNNASLLQCHDQRLSVSQTAMIARVSPSHKPNLDYLTFGNPLAHPNSPPSPVHHKPDVSPASISTSSLYVTVQKSSTSGPGITAPEWDSFLGPVVEGQGNLYDSMYCAPQLSMDTSVTSSAADGSWSPESLDLSTFNLGDFGNPGHGSSLSEESLSSVSGGDDFSSLDFQDFSVGQGGMMSNESFLLDGVRRDSHFL